MFIMAGTFEHAACPEDRVLGWYPYGMFPEDAFLRSFLANLGTTTGKARHDQTVEETLDALADHFATHVDRSRLLALAQA